MCRRPALRCISALPQQPRAVGARVIAPEQLDSICKPGHNLLGHLPAALSWPRASKAARLEPSRGSTSPTSTSTTCGDLRQGGGEGGEGGGDLLCDARQCPFAEVESSLCPHGSCMDQSSSSRASVPARRAAYVPLRARPEAESARRALRTSSSSIRSTCPAPWRRRVRPDVDLAQGPQDRSSEGTDLNNKVQWRQGCQDSGLVLGCHARVESLRRPARLARQQLCINSATCAGRD